MDFIDFIGVSGTVLIVVSYFLLQLERVNANGFVYPFVNFIGSSLLIVSLIYNFNLASFIIEVFWILISLYGVIKYFLRREKA